MSFPESVIISCWNRSDGRCECRRDHPEHRGHGRCRSRFSRNEGWVAYRVIREAPETTQNCELLCPNCRDLTEAGWRPNTASVAHT
jgi:hypothetical protein